jgi:hypothetical protein
MDAAKFVSSSADKNVHPTVILKRAMDHSLILFMRKRDWLQGQA